MTTKLFMLLGYSVTKALEMANQTVLAEIKAKIKY